MTNATFRILFVLFCIAIGTFSEARAQDPIFDRSVDKWKGKPKTVSIDRVYAVISGKQVGSVLVKIWKADFDREGNLKKMIEYGANGEKHATYSRINGTRITKVEYFSSDGKPFIPNANLPAEEDLCNQFSVQVDKNAAVKIDHEYEKCQDGSERANTVSEFDTSGLLVREFRLDAKSRSWESLFDYDKDGNMIKLRFTVNDKKKAEYSQTMNYGDYKFDNTGNFVSAQAVSQISTFPDRIAYQYVEKATIVYYD